MITTINNKHNKLNVPNLRFPEFEGEWEESTIGEMFDLYSGNTPSRLNKEHFKGTVNWISSGELKEHYLSSSKEQISEEAAKNLKLLPVGTFVIAIYGLEAEGVRGTGSITQEPSTISQACMSFIPKGVIENEFLYSWYKKHGNVIGIRYAQGTKQQNLSYDILEKFRIAYPNTKEQEKLNKFISLLDKRIATQNKIIDKLQSLIRGIRNDVFGKFRKSVGVNAMVGEVLSYEQPQPYIVEDTEYTAEGIPVLTANKAFVLGYTSETDGIYDKGDCIIFDDFTLDCKYVDFPFKVKSSAIKILTAKDKELLRYTFEFMKYLDLSTDEHKRHYIAETQNQELFLPTAQVVRTIAHAFSALSSRMKTVTKQRDLFELQKQYLLRQMFI
ncbi:restriction endonuclease subunit S [Leyella stercorea]